MTPDEEVAEAIASGEDRSATDKEEDGEEDEEDEEAESAAAATKDGARVVGNVRSTISK